MKNRLLIIISIVILLLVSLLLIVGLNKEKEDNNKTKEKPNIQNISLTEETINNTTIDNGITLENSKIDCMAELCTISMTAKNKTTSSIDMTNYRISFLDINGEEIYWFSGISIGVVEASSENKILLEIPSTLTNVHKIVYKNN